MTKAQELRDKAAETRKRVEESYERSGNDGFLSQWAGSLTARLYDRQAQIEENGGTYEFPGLFNADGERVKAKLLTVEDKFRGYGTRQVWLVLDEHDNALAWVNRAGKPSDGTPPHPRSKMAKLGLHEEFETAPAEAFMDGRGTGLSGQAWVAVKRTDGGYPEGAKVHGKETV